MPEVSSESLLPFIETHSALKMVRDCVRGTEFEGDVYLVGGAIRDHLLGQSPGSDFDLVTTGDALALAELLAPLSEHFPVTYPRFGTARVTIVGVAIECVTARRESYETESRKPQVEPATLLDDAKRRDFTVNTLLAELSTGQIVDPLGTGLSDLAEQKLQTPLDPDATFFDDPLRMLRAVRFRWKLNFEPAKGLYEAIQRNLDRLEIISFERIRDELLKMLAHPSGPDAWRDLMSLGLLDRIAPEFRAMVDCEQGRYHHLDVWKHTLLVLKHSGHSDPLLQLSALFHDIGKPATRTIDVEGNTRFFSHETVGESMTRAILDRWKFSARDIHIVAKLVRNHMRLGSSPSFSAAAARRLMRDLGDDLERLLQLVDADTKSLRPGVKIMDLDAIRDRLATTALQTPRASLEPPLSGQEIMDLTGLPPGRQVGELKRRLLEAVLDGELTQEDKPQAQRLVLIWQNELEQRSQ